MTELTPPILSPRFDVDDIQKLREYNSLRHINMTAEEIINETVTETADWVVKLVKSGNAKLLPDSPYWKYL